MLKMGFRQFHKALPWTRKTPKRKAIEALNGGKVDVSLSKEIRIGNKVLSLRKVII